MILELIVAGFFTAFGFMAAYKVVDILDKPKVELKAGNDEKKTDSKSD